MKLFYQLICQYDVKVIIEAVNFLVVNSHNYYTCLIKGVNYFFDSEVTEK